MAICMIGPELEANDVLIGGDGSCSQIQPDKGLSVQIDRVSDVVTSVKLNTQRDPITPSGRIDSNELSNDWSVKVIDVDVVSIPIPFKQLCVCDKTIKSNHEQPDRQSESGAGKNDRRSESWERKRKRTCS